MICKECEYEYDDKLKKCPECEEPNPKYKRRDKNDDRNGDDGDEEGGILGQLGDIVGKLFGG